MVTIRLSFVSAYLPVACITWELSLLCRSALEASVLGMQGFSKSQICLLNSKLHHGPCSEREHETPAIQTFGHVFPGVNRRYRGTFQ